MNVTFNPCVLNGNVKVPSSKSETHRALICAALSGGRVNNISLSDDAIATLNALKSLGASYEKRDNAVVFSRLSPAEIKECEIDCGESASTLRFLIPLALLSGKKIKFYGKKSLFKRPLSVYIKLFKENKIAYELGENSLTVCGTLKQKEFKTAGDISSQFVSGLLFVLPLIGGKITLETPLSSAPYVKMTADIMGKFGITVNANENVYTAVGEYKANEYTVKGDCSSAAYIEAFSFLGGDVTVVESEISSEGDGVYKEMFERIRNGERCFDFDNCPDLAPIVFSVAATVGGEYTFSGVSRLRLKESDRLFVMKEALNKFGVILECSERTAVLKANGLKRPDTLLQSENDHRTVMALSLLCCAVGGSITDASAVSKSYPGFFETLKKLGADFII